MVHDPFNIAQHVADLWLSGVTSRELRTVPAIVSAPPRVREDMQLLIESLEWYLDQVSMIYNIGHEHPCDVTRRRIRNTKRG